MFKDKEFFSLCVLIINFFKNDSFSKIVENLLNNRDGEIERKILRILSQEAEARKLDLNIYLTEVSKYYCPNLLLNEVEV